MRILLTNDDGVEAYGLSVLEAIGRTLSDDIWVVAPLTEQSGKGRGVSLHDPVRVKSLGHQRFAVSGTPTDCVQIAVSDLMPDLPDLILSGVNRGFNLAQDITLSGTVAAALQGMSLGVPSIALSQCLDFEFDLETQWLGARQFGPGVVRDLIDKGWPAGQVVMNVNFPDCPPEAVKGVIATRQGFRDLHEMHAVKRTDPRGRAYYWIDFHDLDQTLVAGTDLKAVADHYISVTPIQLDLTCEATLKSMHDLFRTEVMSKMVAP